MCVLHALSIAGAPTQASFLRLMNQLVGELNDRIRVCAVADIPAFYRAPWIAFRLRCV